jgi:hypothetical protein
MEVRHTFSEPRLAQGYDKLTWNVDVFREGVEDPVLTLIIDNDTLPPRMRKKKVVWRLPEDVETLPKFGVEEKKRLLDLFKIQKKSRRKAKLKRSESSGTNPNRDNELSTPQLVKENSNGDEVYRDENSWKAKFKEVAEEKKEDPGAFAPAVPVLASDPPKYATDHDKDVLVAPPPGIHFNSAPSSIPQLSMLAKGESSVNAAPSPSLPKPPPGFSLPLVSLGIHPGRFFTAPRTSDNVAVELAQTFMDVYFRSMTTGQQEDLLMYYVPGAVKSLSLGGAHSFCKSRDEILIQLNSLQGSLWDVSGVVAQEGYLDSVVLLLTGNALPKTAPEPLSFSHAIALIKLTEGYQIHNDAMSLMTPGR